MVDKGEVFKMIDKWELLNKIYNYIEKYDHVTFAELERNIEGFRYKELPHLSMELENQNIVLWEGLSEEAYFAMSELISTGIILAYTTNPLTYHADGKILLYPVAKRPKHKYKNKRWLPVTFRIDINMLAWRDKGKYVDYWDVQNIKEVRKEVDGYLNDK